MKLQMNRLYLFFSFHFLIVFIVIIIILILIYDYGIANLFFIMVNRKTNIWLTKDLVNHISS